MSNAKPEWRFFLILLWNGQNADWKIGHADKDAMEGEIVKNIQLLMDSHNMPTGLLGIVPIEEKQAVFLRDELKDRPQYWGHFSGELRWKELT